MLRLPFVLQQEGGFSNDPLDSGGPTEAGITLASWRLYIKNPKATVAQLRALTANQEAAFYGSQFWNPIRGDDLPAGVDLMVFDEAVNTGQYEAAVLLQRAIGANDDGFIGPLTIAAAVKQVSASLIDTLELLQGNYYHSLAGFPHDGNGWMARLARRAAAAHALIAPSPAKGTV